MVFLSLVSGQAGSRAPDPRSPRPLSSRPELRELGVNDGAAGRGLLPVLKKLQRIELVAERGREPGLAVGRDGRD